MKKRLIAIILLCMMPILLLSGCSKTKKNFEGEVCKLEFQEEYTKRFSRTTMIWTGKFAVPIITWYTRTYPDRWYVQVRRFNAEKQKYEYDECYVTKECFEELKIGDWFVYDTDYCFEDEPYTQVRE